MRPFALTLAVFLATALPGVAVAQDNPLSPLPQAQTTPATVVVAPPTDADSGLKTWQTVLIIGAGLVLLVGVGWAIVSDARNRAPVSEKELAHPGMASSRPNRSQKQKQRARAKAKQGRKQRRTGKR